MDNSVSTPIIIRSMLLKDDFIKANRIAMKIKTKETRWLKRLVTLFILFFVLVIALFVLGSESSQVPPEISNSNVSAKPLYLDLLPVFTMIIFFIGGLVFVKLNQNNAAKKHYDSNAMIQDEVQFTFDPMGIEYKTERVLSKIMWHEIYKLYCSKEFISIFTSNRIAWVIPKRNLTLQQIDDVETMIYSNIEKKKIITVHY